MVHRCDAEEEPEKSFPFEWPEACSKAVDVFEPLLADHLVDAVQLSQTVWVHILVTPNANVVLVEVPFLHRVKRLVAEALDLRVLVLLSKTPPAHARQDMQPGKMQGSWYIVGCNRRFHSILARAYLRRWHMSSNSRTMLSWPGWTYGCPWKMRRKYMMTNRVLSASGISMAGNM